MNFQKDFYSFQNNLSAHLIKKPGYTLHIISNSLLIDTTLTYFPLSVEEQ